MSLTALTDAYGKGPEHAERMRGCARIVQLMLWTWSGTLTMFCCGSELNWFIRADVLLHG